LSILLNIQDSTGRDIVPTWMLPAIAPALYMLGTELGLTELRRAMRKLRDRANQVAPVIAAPLPVLSNKDLVLEALDDTDGNVREALTALRERGVTVGRSYVYEIKRNGTQRLGSPE
jgi:hypothetical protein